VEVSGPAFGEVIRRGIGRGDYVCFGCDHGD
jgi:hypothetical protein